MVWLSEWVKKDKKMGKLLSSHRSTAYPCSVPSLGDSAGAGRERLTHRKSNNNFAFTIKFAKFVKHLVTQFHDGRHVSGIPTT
jgi:hypothetical protein